MDEKKKSKSAEIKAEKPPGKPMETQTASTKERAFPLARLRQDSYKLFGVSTSVFDGATSGYDGEFTVREICAIIKAWKNEWVFPTNKKEDK